MPNYSGVWDLRQQGVAVKGDRWELAPENVFISGVTSRRANEKINLLSSGGATDFGEIRSGAGQADGDFSARAGFGNGVRGIYTAISSNTGGTTDIEYFTAEVSFKYTIYQITDLENKAYCP